MRVATDVGGTFTDFVVLDGRGGLSAFKVPSGRRAEEGVLAGLQRLEADSEDGDGRIAAFHHASTVAANALIEGRGGPVALVTTEGFKDVVAIGTQARLGLYDLTAQKAPVPVPDALRFEVAERIDAKGEVVEPMNDADVAHVVARVRDAGARAVAVCTLFSHLNPVHERRIAAALRDAGLVVSASHEVSPEAREHPRSVTTVADAQVKGPVEAYLARIDEALAAFAEDAEGPVPVRLLTSTGGTVTPDLYRAAPIRGVLSGPVGGVAAAHRLARRLGLERVLTLDMGGTSADLARIGPEGPARTEQFAFRDLPIRVPAVDVHTLGAGGGSIADLDPAGALVVGPQSAGSDPGPVCFGRGGTEPTVTDADLASGLVAPDRFPGGVELDPEAAQAAVEVLSDRAGMDLDETLLGIRRVVEVRMAHGARKVTLARGHDPRGHALMAYGGAGPLHAWAVADELGATTVVVPPLPGVFSALGLMLAEPAVEEVQGLAPTQDLEGIHGRVEEVVARARRRAAALGDGEPATDVRIDCRYAGQSHALPVGLPGGGLEGLDGLDGLADLADAFHAEHARARGHTHPDRAVEAVGVRVRCGHPAPDVELPGAPGASSTEDAEGRGMPSPDPVAHRDVLWPDGRRKTPAFDRADLPGDWSADGPLIVHDPGATCAVPPGWRLTVEAGTGALRLEVAP